MRVTSCDSERSLSRRTFIGRSLAATTAIGMPLFLPPHVLGRGAPGPNEQIRIGFIGCGGRARQLMDQIPAEGRIVALADCYRDRLTGTLAQKQAKWPTYQDYRQMLDREQLDAVVVATPDHGRSLPCLRAMEAGLDVYAEKPLTAYVREGRVLADTARRLGRVFQVGSQQRTMEINKFCCELVRDGKIGAVKKVLAVAYSGPRPYQPLPTEAIPEGDDWDTWCGPTPLCPFNAQLQFGWMQWRDYSGGTMTNWGAHGIDQIQWRSAKA